MVCIVVPTYSVFVCFVFPKAEALLLFHQSTILLIVLISYPHFPVLETVILHWLPKTTCSMYGAIPNHSLSVPVFPLAHYITT